MISGSLTDTERETMQSLGVIVVDSPLFAIFSKLNSGPTARYRQRLWVYELINYEKVVFFAPNVRFVGNADALFATSSAFSGISSAEAPVVGDFFVTAPDRQVLADILDLVEWQTKKFSKAKGWMGHGAIQDWRSSDPDKKTDWSFPRADLDCGILYYYWAISKAGQSAEILDPHAWDAYVNVIQAKV